MEVHLIPDQEAFFRQRVRIGRFATADEAVREAVSLLEANEFAKTPESDNSPKTLVEVCAMVTGLAADLDFSRNPSTGCPVDLS